MKGSCEQENCTVIDTGTCLLNNDPNNCPKRRDSTGGDPISDPLAPVLEGPKSHPKLPASGTLSLEDAAGLTRHSYASLIGILGFPNAGKTAAIVSLYLLLSKNRLSGFEIRDSKTLMAFEQISKGARRWNNQSPPDQMTTHTELPEERPAGLLHFKIEELSTGMQAEFLLPDLPGEWSDHLIDRNRTDRLQFMKSADAFWIVVDGSEFEDDYTRQHALHRSIMLIERLSEMLVGKVPPVTLVVTKLDKCNVTEEALRRFIDEASRLKISLRIVRIASFSENQQVAPGTGLADLIKDAFCGHSAMASEMWPEVAHRQKGRQMLNFGLKE